MIRNATYYEQKGATCIGHEEVKHFKLNNNAYKPDRIKLEMVMIPETKTYNSWTIHIVQILTDQGCYRQWNTAPKGDLERKVQACLDEISL